MGLIRRWRDPMGNFGTGLLIALCLILIVFLAMGRCEAQFIGYVSPQTVQQTLASTLTCTGAVQTFPINNLGQTQHYLTVSAIGATNTFQAVIQGVDALGNIVPISDQLQGVGTVKGSGYYPKVQVQVTCTTGSASFSATYSGAWGTYDSATGTYLLAQTDKLLFTGSAANTNATNLIQTPFGSSAGTLFFKYSAGNAGATITIACDDASSSINPTVYTASLANTTNLQTFVVPGFTCPYVFVTYNNNGALGSIFTEMVFSPPGTAQVAYQYTHITGTTATVVKGTPGLVHTLSINLGAAGTVSLFDLASASCTGTPATNQVAIITATATTLQTLTYDVNFLNGICLKASVAMDITVSAQ